MIHLSAASSNRKYEGYRLVDQWTSYGWNVFVVQDGNAYDQVVAVLKTMEHWDPADRRPMAVIGKTTKGYWPAAVDHKIPDFGDQIVGYPSHPYAMKMNSEYFLALARTFESKYGVEFQGIRDGAVKDPRERLIQFKTNMDVVMSLLDRNGIGDWLADRLVENGESLPDSIPLRLQVNQDPFQDERLRVANLPVEPQKVSVTNAVTGAKKDASITLFRKAGDVAGTRRGISEIVKWVNYVTGNRFITAAADLSESINLEHGSMWGHYDPESNVVGTRLKAAIQEAGNVSTAIGLVSQSAALDPDRFAGVWAISGTYGAFTPLMYTPARVWSQQNQDSPFRNGVLHILVGHSGPETAADGRTHFGILRAAGVEALPARPDDSPQFLGLQRRGARLLRRRRDRGSREEGRHHHARSCASGFPGGRSFDVRRQGSARGVKRLLRDSRLQDRAASWLCHHAGVELYGQPGECAAKARGGRCERGE